MSPLSSSFGITVTRLLLLVVVVVVGVAEVNHASPIYNKREVFAHAPAVRQAYHRNIYPRYNYNHRRQNEIEPVRPTTEPPVTVKPITVYPTTNSPYDDEVEVGPVRDYPLAKVWFNFTYWERRASRILNAYLYQLQRTWEILISQKVGLLSPDEKLP